MLAPISWRVPPRHYGPWEQFVSLLTEGLVARGVDVTLFATGDSLTTARLSSTVARGWSEDPAVDAKVSECLHISAVFERAGEFDLIHNSFDFLPLTYSALVSTPVLTTIHGFSSPAIVPVYEKYNRHGAYVAISEADRHPRLDYVATIHYGIDTDAFALGASPGGYLLFFGRIHPEKGAAEAIDVARRVGLPLVMAGIVQDQRYYDEQVAPHVDDRRVRYLGPVGPEQRSSVLPPAAAGGPGGRPQDRARRGRRHCDVVSMHGYPANTAWADGPTDDHLLPFLALLTRWIAGGADVLFEEFGLATGSSGATGPGRLVDEQTAAAYTGRALDGLRHAGCTGALLWCFADYAPALHGNPPFDVVPHERSFGLWRSDGSAKPAVGEITGRAGRRRVAPPTELAWLDIGVAEFSADRRRQLPRLYRRYRQCHNAPSGP
jgi:glycosyltransferase involved in cell wall biosynthesis